jgi:hypothetical protein
MPNLEKMMFELLCVNIKIFNITLFYIEARALNAAAQGP